MAASPKSDTRFVFLNRIVSRSVSRGPEEFKPPLHGIVEAIDILEQRFKSKVAIEFFGNADEAFERDDEDARIKASRNLNSIRLSQLRRVVLGSDAFAVLLFEHIDQTARSFPVVHTSTFKGREISGERDERGASSCHLVIKLPKDGGFDDGSYRCVIEHVSPFTRKMIERFLCQQLRRHARQADFSFTVETLNKKNRTEEKSYKYYPQLQLMSDIGRSLAKSWTAEKKLIGMQFTKRNERPSAAVATKLSHEDVVGDVTFRVDLKSGPEDPSALAGWVNKIRTTFYSSGYTERLYYRHITGATISGTVDHKLEGAADLLLCQRDVLELKGGFKLWTPRILDDVVDEMIKRARKDDLWQRPEQN